MSSSDDSDSSNEDGFLSSFVKFLKESEEKQVERNYLQCQLAKEQQQLEQQQPSVELPREETDPGVSAIKRFVPLNNERYIISSL